MAGRLIREEHGVRLEFCEVAPERRSGTGGAHYRISSKRPVQPIVRSSEAEAEACFRREVEASKRDPLVARIVARGL